MNKAKIVVSAIIIYIFTGVLSSVNAQYDNNVVLPEYRDGAEVYGIDIEAKDRVTFFPEGCESIDKVTIVAKNTIAGEIVVKALSENPKDNNNPSDKVFEYCEVELVNIDKSDIEETLVEAKVRKSWLKDNDVRDDQIALFTFNNGDNAWKQQSTTKKTESSIYYYYESKAENFPYWAVGKANTSIFGSINPGLILLCCIILLILLILLALLLASRRRGETARTESRQEA